ncbi:MAG: fumarylacetoacetate hydrolase family protein [Chloroflexi bacterium]|nr:fumarylacetoacetate hydrolase family protein [Chloroflexota bacterium]
MKLVFFNDYQLGILKGTTIIDASPAVREAQAPTPQGLMEQVIIQFSRLAPRLRELGEQERGIPLEKVRLRPPLPWPGKIICAAVNYLEFGQRTAAEKDCFLKPATAVIGPGDTVVLPEIKATVFHHEAELAVVIGKEAKGIPAARAMDYVFGYTCFLDMSARGLAPEGRTSFFLGKAWDTFAPIGPCITTADEIPDPNNLRVRLWVDDQPRHDFNTSDMAHKVPALIEFASSVCTLKPGDVIATGTNHQGIGPIQDGETVTIEIEGIGRMSVKVRDPLKRTWPKAIDREFARGVIERARR